MTHPKKANTPYCEDHKRTVDALHRQARKDKSTREKVAEISKKGGPVWQRLVERFEHECPAPGNGLP
eukprot:3884634-Alexandrium_andersonii.AAC.1